MIEERPLHCRKADAVKYFATIRPAPRCTLRTPDRRTPGDMSVEPVPPLTAALSCAVLGAGVAGLVPPLPAVGIAVALATGVHATLLVRHAWSIHTQTHSFGPCRGSGFLGLGTLVAGTAVVAAVVLVAGGRATGPAGAGILTGGLLVAGGPSPVRVPSAPGPAPG